MRIAPLLLVATVTALSGQVLAGDIQGQWHTDATSALAAARRAKRPVLAVAMDHA